MLPWHKILRHCFPSQCRIHDDASMSMSMVENFLILNSQCCHLTHLKVRCHESVYDTLSLSLSLSLSHVNSSEMKVVLMNVLRPTRRANVDGWGVAVYSLTNHANSTLVCKIFFLIHLHFSLSFLYLLLDMTFFSIRTLIV